MAFVLLTLAVFLGLAGVTFAGRLLIVALCVRAHFESETELWRYAATAGVTIGLAVWLLTLSLPVVLS